MVCLIAMMVATGMSDKGDHSMQSMNHCPPVIPDWSFVFESAQHAQKAVDCMLLVPRPEITAHYSC